MLMKLSPGNNTDNDLTAGAWPWKAWGEPSIKVKVMSRGLKRGRPIDGFLRQFPGNRPQWGNCLFDFDVDSRDYDWLVVYHDLPKGEGLFNEEKLACPRERTMLITCEPSSITVFGSDYLRQFGHILTFQEPWAIRHPSVIFHHPGLVWYYGRPFDGRDFITWNQMAATPPPVKTRLLSTVCSRRTGNLTLHSTRVKFTRQLKKEIEDLDIYGHGVNPMNDKAEVLDPYRFHIAVENHVAPYHLTEKLPDAFLGYTLPFYHGAPNATDYFPEESFIPIDITNYSRTRDIIKSHLANNEYDDRLPYIIEARRRVLEEQNLYSIINRQINIKEQEIVTLTPGGVIRNRPTLRMKNPIAGIRGLAEKGAVKLYYFFAFWRRNCYRLLRSSIYRQHIGPKRRPCGGSGQLNRPIVQ